MRIIFRSIPVTEPFTYESIGKDWTQYHVSRPGGYPFYHYLQTEKGAGRVETPAGSCLLHEGEGLLMAPFIRHSYEKSGNDWVVKYATFTGTAERAIPQIMGNRQMISTGAAQGERISRLIDDGIAISTARPLDVKKLSVNCYSVLIQIADTTHGSRSDEPLYRSYVLPVMKEIESSYFLPLTIEKLSRQVFITPQYLSRLFHRYLNCSAYEYLTSYRLSKAKELLITAPRLEIQEIARRTGFTDSSHFIAVFKKAVGVTPLEFRRLN